MIVVEIDDPLWVDFVHACPAALPFHHPAWTRLLADCYGYRPLALVLAGDAGQLVAGLPVLEVRSPFGKRRWLSLPFTDYCPPLALSDAVRAKLVSELDAERQEAGISRIEVRASLDGPGAIPHSNYVLHTLRLVGGPQTIFRTFKRTQIQQRIAKAEREGVAVRRSDSLSDLTEVFYDLHARTRQRLGAPVQPRRFFKLFHESIIKAGLGFVHLAYLNGTPIAGAVFLSWNQTVIYKYSASDVRFLRHRPNNLVLWRAIQWAAENDCRVFDFGRSELNDHGLRNFKSGWGTEEKPLTYTEIADHPAKRSFAAREEVVLAGLIRRSPPWVARVIGELFYKYAA
jgi:CelD/BcsL family acetyltransferase involved in cellulose biosynthesis